MKDKLASNSFCQAITNAWQISGEQSDLVSRLINCDSTTYKIDFFYRQYSRLPGENSEDYYIRIHKEVKGIIRAQQAPSVSNEVKYEFIQFQSTFLFFFISDKEVCIESKISELEKLQFDKLKLIQTLIRLKLKVLLLEKANREYFIEPYQYNSAIYIGAIKTKTKGKGKGTILEVLEPKLYLSEEKLLILELHSRVIMVDSASIMSLTTDDVDLLIQSKSNSYLPQKFLDARRFKKRKFMRFQKNYVNCQNYHYHQLSPLVAEILDDAKVDFNPFIFRATNIHSNFIAQKSTELSRPINIIDIASRANNSNAASACQAIERTFKNVSYKNHIQHDENNLVINSKADLNSSSIKDTKHEKNFSSFWQALRYSKKNGDTNLDFYTHEKIKNFLAKKKGVMQGVDILESSTNSEQISTQVLVKLKKELSLKEQVFIHKEITNLDGLKKGKFKAIYVRKPEREFYTSVINIHVTSEGIFIDNHEIYNDQDEMLFNNPFLSVADHIPDRAFYLYDCDTRSLLTAYTSINIPQIIGNKGFSNIDRFNESDSLRKLSSPNDSPLPYYINPKINGRYHQVFVQDADSKLYYFVSPKGNPRSDFDKRLRVYSLIVWDKDGRKVPPAQQPITEYYLTSFTDDILLNNQVSKSSLFTKIAKLFIEN